MGTNVVEKKTRGVWISWALGALLACGVTGCTDRGDVWVAELPESPELRPLTLSSGDYVEYQIEVEVTVEAIADFLEDDSETMLTQADTVLFTHPKTDFEPGNPILYGVEGELMQRFADGYHDEPGASVEAFVDVELYVDCSCE